MAEDDAPPKPASVKEEASPPADPALTEAAPATTIEADTVRVLPGVDIPRQQNCPTNVLLGLLDHRRRRFCY